MPSNIEIVESEPKHVRELSKNIREKDCNEAKGLGLVPHKALFYAYKHSLMRRTALVDGEVAAMWGVAGTPLGNLGQPYLITSYAVEKISPFRFARIYKEQVNDMTKLFNRLENFVDANYEGAIRMLQIAGFNIEDKVLLGPEHKPFYRFTLVTD